MIGRRDDDIGGLGILLGVAALSMLSRRNRAENAPQAVPEGETCTAIISPEVQAEIDRAPRAYARRLAREMSKTKK